MVYHRWTWSTKWMDPKGFAFAQHRHEPQGTVPQVITHQLNHCFCTQKNGREGRYFLNGSSEMSHDFNPPFTPKKRDHHPPPPPPPKDDAILPARHCRPPTSSRSPRPSGVTKKLEKKYGTVGISKKSSCSSKGWKIKHIIFKTTRWYGRMRCRWFSFWMSWKSLLSLLATHWQWVNGGIAIPRRPFWSILEQWGPVLSPWPTLQPALMCCVKKIHLAGPQKKSYL